MDNATRGLVSMLMLMSNGEGALCKAFYRKFGKDALPVIKEVMTQGGVEWGKIMQQTIPVKSMTAITQQTSAMGSMMGIGIETVEASDNMIHNKLSKCPLGLEGTSRELCEAVMAIDHQRISTFFGQPIDMQILQTVAAGDKQCEFIFSKK